MAEIEISQDRGICTILLNRPERRNALTIPMMDDLGAHLARIAEDESVRVVILTGAGKVFCSGLDLAAMGASPTEPALEAALVENVLVPLERLPQPTIAAMNGDGLAGGCELALHCDVRIATAETRLGMPVARIGIVVPYPLILKLLDKTIGIRAAKEDEQEGLDVTLHGEEAYTLAEGPGARVFLEESPVEPGAQGADSRELAESRA